MKVETSTIVRTIVLIIALINQILSVTGHSPLPITDDQVNELVTLAITVCVSIWTWWKNNSFTQSALMADEYRKKIKKN
uniref:phage holin n=1 Tax=Methanobrevibacter smithii TaxID=2173 RepID=UPI0037DDC5C2